MKKRIYFILLCPLLLANYDLLLAEEEGADSMREATDPPLEQAADAPVAPSDVTQAADDPDLVSKRGYFYGYYFGNMLKDDDSADVDLQALLKGVEDSLADEPFAMTDAEREAVLQFGRDRLAARQAASERANAEYLREGQEFLAANADERGVEVTDSGLQILELESGSGSSPEASDRVVVHYEGRLVSGEVFDSSRTRGEPAEFELGRVIKGWTEGLQLMKPGGKYRLFVPSELGYGSAGVGNIPPNAVLIFDIELIEVKSEG